MPYEPQAWLAQSALAWVALPLTYRLVDAQAYENVNRVFGPGTGPQRLIPPLAYLALTMIAFPLVIYWPMHLLSLALFG